MTSEFTTSQMRVPMVGRKSWQRYAIAIAAVIVVTAAREILNLFVPVPSHFILFYPAVMFAAWYGGFGPGFLATVLSIFFGDELWKQPYLSLTDPNRAAPISVMLFAFVNVVICMLTENLRRAVIQNNQSAKEIIESRNRVLDILESIQGCFFSVNRDGKIVHVNEGCQKYLDFSEEIMGKLIWGLLPKWENSEFGERYRDVMSQRHEVRFEFYDSFESRWHEVHISPSSEGLSVHLFDVTTRKAAESRLRRLAESDIIGVIFGKSDSRIIDEANNVFLKMLGYSREELKRGELHEPSITPEEYRDLDRNKWEECRRNASCEPWEKEYFRKDGSRVPVLMGMTFLDATGLEWACFVVDLSEHKTQERLQATEYAITQILTLDPTVSAAIPKILERICASFGWKVGIFWEGNPDAEILRIGEFWTLDSEKYQDFLEYCSQMSMQRGYQLLPGLVWKSKKPLWIADIEKSEDFVRRPAALRAGFLSSFSFPIRLGEDILGVLEFFSSEVKQPNKALPAMVDAIGSEIGQFIERKQAEKELRLSQQHFNLALQAAKMGYWSWDLPTGKMEWSENLEFFHGRRSEEFEGTFEAFLASIHPEDREIVGKTFLESIRSNSDYQLEFRVLWPDVTTHWIDARGQVFYDEDGDALRMIGLLIDITERKLAEETLRLTNEELERRVKARTFELDLVNQDLKVEIAERQRVEREALEIVQKEQRRFSAQLHDGLCQNLTGILMMSKAMAQKLEKKSVSEASDLKVISSLVDQSITEARDMARGLFPVELESNSLMFSLHGLAVRTAQLYQVTCRFYCPEPILMGDNVAATHLFRIAQEALHNAISHGGARHLELSLTRETGQIFLKVKDDGKGFSQDHKVSSGIGMHIMRYRARMLDASLHFENLTEEGTLFVCVLPFPNEGLQSEA